MTIYLRGGWHYDQTIAPYKRSFVWHVVRFKLDPAPYPDTLVGMWIAGGVARSRNDARRLGLAAIDRDVQSLARGTP